MEKSFDYICVHSSLNVHINNYEKIVFINQKNKKIPVIFVQYAFLITLEEKYLENLDNIEILYKSSKNA